MKRKKNELQSQENDKTVDTKCKLEFYQQQHPLHLICFNNILM